MGCRSPSGRASPKSLRRSGAAVAALSHISGFRRWSGIELERRLLQALRSSADDNLAKRQQDYRYDEGGEIIEDAEQQHAAEQLLPVHLPEADQHRGVEHPEASGRVAGKAE